MIDKRDCIVVDIDGTLVDSSYPVSYLTGTREKKNYQTYYRLLDIVEPISEVVKEVKYQINEYECDVVFLTGRNWEKHVAYNTAETIEKIFPEYIGQSSIHFDIRFRGLNNNEPSHVYKKKQIESLSRDYNILALFDDEPAIIEMYLLNSLLLDANVYCVKYPTIEWDFSNFKHFLKPNSKDSKHLFIARKNPDIALAEEHTVLF